MNPKEMVICDSELSNLLRWTREMILVLKCDELLVGAR